MAYFDTTYKFLLDGVQVYPLVSNEFNIEWEKEQDTFYFRRTLSDDVKFVNVDYDNINDSTIDHKFEFKIQYNNAGTWEDFYTGFFYKTDCNFDDDYKKLTVSPISDDGWEDIKKVLNNEYNFIDLNPITTPIIYKLRPILQIILRRDIGGVYNSGLKMININGVVYWEEDLKEEYSGTDLVNNYGFRAYQVLPSAEEFIYFRYLTTLDTWDIGLGPFSTIDRPVSDVSNIAYTYDKIANDTDLYSYFDIERVDDLVDNPTKYGKATNCVATPEKYYNDFQDSQAAGVIVIPVIPSNWGCKSYWWAQTDNIIGIEFDNSEEITLSDAYKIVDIIQLLLEQETDILHAETTAYSEFLYDTVDPIASKKYIPIITPKSNVVNSFYNQNAKKSNIRLKDILELLEVSFNVFWHIEEISGEKRLRLEHISWYENGGTYGDQEISLNMVTTLDKRNNFPLAYYQNKFFYNKTKMPQRYEFNWMNDVSNYFNGYPINIISPIIENGLIENMDAKLFNPDIDSITGRTDISLDNYVIFKGELDSGDYYVKTEQVEIIPGTTFNIQNGAMSFWILHPLYHRYHKPASEIQVNGQETTALSIIRNKQQEVKFTYEDITIDPLKLITTYLGSGQVENMSLNLVSNKYEITINHDTE